MPRLDCFTSEDVKIHDVWWIFDDCWCLLSGESSQTMPIHTHNNVPCHTSQYQSYIKYYVKIFAHTHTIPRCSIPFVSAGPPFTMLSTAIPLELVTPPDDSGSVKSTMLMPRPWRLSFNRRTVNLCACGRWSCDTSSDPLCITDSKNEWTEGGHHGNKVGT